MFILMHTSYIRVCIDTELRIKHFSDSYEIIIFLVIALGLSCAFIVVNFALSPKNPDPEKLSAYECGFEAFDDSRMEFDVRFYLVAVSYTHLTLPTNREV